MPYRAYAAFDGVYKLLRKAFHFRQLSHYRVQPPHVPQMHMLDAPLYRTTRQTYCDYRGASRLIGFVQVLYHRALRVRFLASNSLASRGG
jgi:hypothetical protein